MAQDLKEWYNNIPPITRVWFTLITALPLAGRFGIVSGRYMYLIWEFLFSKGQIWRPITATFFYPITPQSGFHYLITVYFIYNYSFQLETGVYKGRPADYVMMLAVSWISCFVLALAFQIGVFMDMSMFVVLYVWCMINRDEIVSFWFGTKFKAAFFPWVLLGFRLIIQGRFLAELCGIAAGHLYFFLKFKYPIDFGGPSLVDTPRFLHKYFPSTRTTAGFGSTGQPLRRAPDAGEDDDVQYRGRHQWGQGRRLADD